MCRFRFQVRGRGFTLHSLEIAPGTHINLTQPGAEITLYDTLKVLDGYLSSTINARLCWTPMIEQNLVCSSRFWGSDVHCAVMLLGSYFLSFYVEIVCAPCNYLDMQFKFQRIRSALNKMCSTYIIRVSIKYFNLFLSCVTGASNERHVDAALLANTYCRSQMHLSEQMSQMHPELTMPMFSGESTVTT